MGDPVGPPTYISMAFMPHIYLLDFKICKDIVPVICILIQCAQPNDENIAQ